MMLMRKGRKEDFSGNVTLLVAEKKDDIESIKERHRCSRIRKERKIKRKITTSTEGERGKHHEAFEAVLTGFKKLPKKRSAVRSSVIV